MTVTPLAFDIEPSRGCIRCGICLESCPTYLITRLEPESPRGRIHPMEQLSLGRLAATDTLRSHLDRCLRCAACEAVCPSGVGYGALIENARAAIEVQADKKRSAPASWLRRAALATLADPARLGRIASVLSLYERTGLRRLIRATGLRARLPRPVRRLDGLYPPLTRPRLPPPAPPGAPGPALPPAAAAARRDGAGRASPRLRHARRVRGRAHRDRTCAHEA